MKIKIIDSQLSSFKKQLLNSDSKKRSLKNNVNLSSSILNSGDGLQGFWNLIVGAVKLEEKPNNINMHYCRTVYLLNSNLSGNKAVTISLQKSSYGFQALKSTDKNGTVFLLFLDSSSKKFFKVNLLTVSYIKVILAQGLASVNSKTLARFERPKKSRLSAKNKLKRLFSKLKKGKLSCFINFNTNKDLVVEAFKKQRKAQQRRIARRTLYNKAVREDAIVSTKMGIKAVVSNGARSNYRRKKQLRGIFVRKPFRAYLNKKTRSGAAKRLGRFARFRRTLFLRVFKKASKIKPSKSLLLSTGLRKHYYRPEPFFKYDIHPRLLIKRDFVSGRVKPYHVKAYNKPFYKKTHKRHAIRKTKPRKRKLYIASSKGSLTRRLHTLSQSPKKYSRVLRPYKQDIAKSRVAIKYFKQKKIFRTRRPYYKAHTMLLRHIYFKWQQYFRNHLKKSPTLKWQYKGKGTKLWRLKKLRGMQPKVRRWAKPFGRVHLSFLRKHIYVINKSSLRFSKKIRTNRKFYWQAFKEHSLLSINSSLLRFKLGGLIKSGALYRALRSRSLLRSLTLNIKSKKLYKAPKEDLYLNKSSFLKTYPKVFRKNKKSGLIGRIFDRLRGHSSKVTQIRQKNPSPKKRLAAKVTHARSTLKKNNWTNSADFKRVSAIRLKNYTSSFARLKLRKLILSLKFRKPAKWQKSMQLNLVLKHRRFYKNPRLIKHFKFRKKELGRHFIARGHLEKLLQKIAKRRSTFHQIKKDTRSIIAHFIRLSKVHRLVRSAHKKTVNRVVSRNKVMLIKLDAMEANRVYSFKLIGRNVDSGLNEIAQNLFELKSNLESKQSSSLLFSNSMPVVNRSYTNFNRFTRRLWSIRKNKRHKLRNLQLLLSARLAANKRSPQVQPWLKGMGKLLFQTRRMSRKVFTKNLRRWWIGLGWKWRRGRKFRHKRLKTFAYLFKGAQGNSEEDRFNYRKLKRNSTFVKLMRAMLNYLIGVSERTLLTSWVKASRGNSSNDSINTLDRFVQSLFMRLDNFALFLGFSPNRVIAREFVRFGGFRINEKVVTNVNYALCANDIFQVSLTAKSYLRNLYGTRVSKFGLETRIRYVNFLQVNWALMLFQFIRLPYNYEITGYNKFMNLRWLRFFIRYLPKHVSQYKAPKLQWYKY